MKSGYIIKTNPKGQIVIPKELRESLDIDKDTPLNLIKRGEGIYLSPVSEVIPKAEEEDSYVEVLKKTKGTWANE